MNGLGRVNPADTSTDSIKNAASTATYGMMTYYTGNETGGIPGAFPSKWWEGSALLLALLNYWHFTGDDYYNEELSIALQWQSGTNGDYMPTNYSSFLVRNDSNPRRTMARIVLEMLIHFLPG